jgi:hypothetical protein
MERTEADLARLDVIPLLPFLFDPEAGGELPPGLIGSTVIKFGTVARHIVRDLLPGLEGGGLIIHYRAAGETRTRVVALSMCEEGMWIEYPSSMNGRFPVARENPAGARESSH